MSLVEYKQQSDRLAIQRPVISKIVRCLPTPDDILKPPEQFLKNTQDVDTQPINTNTNTNQQQQQFFQSIYRRFADPVPDYQASYQDVLTENPSLLRVFPSIQPNQYNSKDPMKQHIRYQNIRPITRELQLKDDRIPIELW